MCSLGPITRRREAGSRSGDDGMSWVVAGLGPPKYRRRGNERGEAGCPESQNGEGYFHSTRYKQDDEEAQGRWQCGTARLWTPPQRRRI